MNRTLDDVTHVVWLGSRRLTATMDGDDLVIAPRDRITDEVRAYVREHRDEIAGAVASDDLWSLRRQMYGAIARGESS
jgi:hypothetical protein